MSIHKLKLGLIAVAITMVASLTVGQPVAATTAVGPIPSQQDFVVQQYLDFLSRNPESPGLDYWTSQLQAGVSPGALVEALALSQEFQGTVAPIVRLYYAHFLRAPRYQGITYWAQIMRQGATITAISDEFVKSQEFQNRYGALSDTEYVQLVYANVLGRPPEAKGLQFWLDQMRNGLTRGGLMVEFSNSAEYRKIIDPRVQATMLYVGMLRRAPDAKGLNYWSGVIGGGTSYAQVIAGFLASNEYARRMNAIFVEQHPLSGVAAREALSRPALAVKIDNHPNARPQKNIDRADLIYEEMVEYNLTRLIAVFHSDMPDVVGPVRSIRTSDIDILAQLNTPLLSASGANSGVLAAVGQADLVNVNAIEAGRAYFRAAGLSAPHNLFARTDDLYAAAAGRGGTPPPLFSYRAPGSSVVGGVPIVGVGVNFGRTYVDFQWDASVGGWKRWQDGTPHITQRGVRLAPNNVVVLEMTYGVSPADNNSPEVQSIGSGNAFVFTNGQIVFGTWSRSAASQPIAILDANNNPIALTPGNTMIELAPPGTITIRQG